MGEPGYPFKLSFEEPGTWNINPNICLLCGSIADLQAPLFPDEECLVSKAVPKRRREFTAGRTLARRALRLSNMPVGPILHDNRMPRWHPPATGSISHCETHCAAAVASTSDVRSIGIDLETIGRVSRDLWPSLFTIEERNTIENLPARERSFYATACFGAKEAFYKLQYSICRQWVNFEDVSVTIDAPEQFTVDTRRANLPSIPGAINGTILRPRPDLVLCLLRLPAACPTGGVQAQQLSSLS